MIGGILSSTILTLFLLPVLYGWFEPAVTEDDHELESNATHT